jgi:hypothetical protein
MSDDQQLVVRRSRTSAAILSKLDAERWEYGAALVTKTLQGSSVVARMLRRFMAAGLVESMLEEADESATFERGYYGRRARREFNRLTPAGVALQQQWSASE